MKQELKSDLKSLRQRHQPVNECENKRNKNSDVHGSVPKNAADMSATHSNEHKSNTEKKEKGLRLA